MTRTCGLMPRIPGDLARRDLHLYRRRFRKSLPPKGVLQSFELKEMVQDTKQAPRVHSLRFRIGLRFSGSTPSIVHFSGFIEMRSKFVVRKEGCLPYESTFRHIRADHRRAPLSSGWRPELSCYLLVAG